MLGSSKALVLALIEGDEEARINFAISGRLYNRATGIHKRRSSESRQWVNFG
jgi:hypothetical protein